MMSQYPEWTSSLADTLRPDIQRMIEGFAETLKDHVGSPIELQFVVSFWSALRFNGLDAVLLRDGSQNEKYDEACRNHDFSIALQYPWRKYRSDLCLGGRHIGQRVLVECDGHNFHERTKGQAAHDRRKDMFAQQDGYHIVRFTGAQIYRNAYGCGYDLLNFVASRRALVKAAP